MSARDNEEKYVGYGRIAERSVDMRSSFFFVSCGGGDSGKMFGTL